jgi:putative nucleotidyltransferase with HDIG domain
LSDPAAFLTAFAQALATMTLYAAGHPARERAIDAAYRQLQDLQADAPHPLFTFLGDEIVYGDLPLRDLKAWDWAQRLARAGIERLEFAEQVARDEFEQFLDEVLARLTLSTLDTSEARQMRRTGIRYGTVGVRGEAEAPAIPTATISYSLGEEVDTVRWMQAEVQARGAIPLQEAEAVIQSLSLAMHSGRQVLIPLLQLKEFDQYTTTHSMNVAVLAMALAEYLGLGAREVRGFGIAGLLHDIGKVRIPLDVLTKPGRFTEEERALMNRHPVEGARIILESEAQLDLPAIVAYEHHIMLNGGGYPTLTFPRDCHRASKLVHVCDVYDALRTNRPYREAWSQERVLGYLEGRGNMEFDTEFVDGFVRMIRKWESQIAVIYDEHGVVPTPGAAGAAPAVPAPGPTA